MKNGRVFSIASCLPKLILLDDVLERKILKVSLNK
jgi:hypothetical protein